MAIRDASPHDHYAMLPASWACREDRPAWASEASSTAPARRARKQWWVGTGLNRRHQDFSDPTSSRPQTTDLSSCVAIRDLIGEASHKSVGSGVDWASMWPSGDYVVVNVAGHYDILDEQMTLLRTLDIDGGGHDL